MTERTWSISQRIYFDNFHTNIKSYSADYINDKDTIFSTRVEIHFHQEFISQFLIFDFNSVEVWFQFSNVQRFPGTFYTQTVHSS